MKSTKILLGLVSAAAFAAAAASARAQTCGNGQPVTGTPATVALLPTLVYEVDYAVASKVDPAVTQPAFSNTIVTVGLPKSSTARCRVQVRWVDWNGATKGISGPQFVGPGQSLEFTSSVNTGNPTEYPPYCENVFRNAPDEFEGYAQILTDANCPAGTRFRVDAEWVTATPLVGTQSFTYFYKPVAVSAPAGVAGY